MAGDFGKDASKLGTLTMHFKMMEETVVLQGNHSLDTIQVSLKSLVKTFKESEQ